MPLRCFLIILGTLLAAAPGYGQFKKKFRSKKAQYHEVNFEDLMRRYLDKDTGPLMAVEGIYSVSCVIIKTGKNLLGAETERTLERKDNYARVAILRDRPDANRDYIEVSLSYKEENTYPIMGEFHILSEGRGLIYKHVEPDGTLMSFSMTNQGDLIEGEFSEIKRNKTITYRLSYLRTYPKASDLTLN